LGFFAAGFFVVFDFLRDGFTSSSPALSCAVSLASASSSMSDASFSTSSPPRFRFALADSCCEDGAGMNFSGAFTARPDLRRPPVATGELATSLFEISIKGVLDVVIDSSGVLDVVRCCGDMRIDLNDAAARKLVLIGPRSKVAVVIVAGTARAHQMLMPHSEAQAAIASEPAEPCFSVDVTLYFLSYEIHLLVTKTLHCHIIVQTSSTLIIFIKEYAQL
jgi:hypothetical protein